MIKIYIFVVFEAFVIFKCFDLPVFTAKDNLYGMCLVLFMFGIASVPMVHLFEKLFNDVSMANASIVIANVMLATGSRAIIILMDQLCVS